MSKSIVVFWFGAAVLSLAATLSGCAKELGRVPFRITATDTASLELARGEVDFWTDLQLVYLGNPWVLDRIGLEQTGSTVASTVCDPLGPRRWSVWEEFWRGPYHHVKGRAQMLCSAVLPKAGATRVRVTLDYDASAKNVAVTKADLVIKQ